MLAGGDIPEGVEGTEFAISEGENGIGVFRHGGESFGKDGLGDGRTNGEELEGALNEGGKGLVAEGAEGIGEGDRGFSKDHAADDRVLEMGEVVFARKEIVWAPRLFVEEPALASDARGCFAELPRGPRGESDLVPVSECCEVVIKHGLVGAQEEGEVAGNQGVADVAQEEGFEVVTSGEMAGLDESFEPKGMSVAPDRQSAVGELKEDAGAAWIHSFSDGGRQSVAGN